jgi:hypothetical protein
MALMQPTIQKPYLRNSLQLARYHETESIQMDRYRCWILSEATGGLDDIYCGGVFARHTDGKGSCSPMQDRSGNSAIEYGHFTRADDAHTKGDMYPNALWRWYY